MGMSLYEYLYERRCRTPVNWDYPVNRVVLGPYMEILNVFLVLNQNINGGMSIYSSLEERCLIWHWKKNPSTPTSKYRHS